MTIEISSQNSYLRKTLHSQYLNMRYSVYLDYGIRMDEASADSGADDVMAGQIHHFPGARIARASSKPIAVFPKNCGSTDSFNFPSRNVFPRSSSSQHATNVPFSVVYRWR